MGRDINFIFGRYIGFYFEIVQVQLYNWSDTIKYSKNEKEKYENRNFCFSSLGLDISGKYAHFLEGLKIPYLSTFLSAWSDNIKSVKKNKEEYRKIENNFLLALGLDIDGKLAHFLKGLKIPNLSILLSVWSNNIKSVKERKKNIEKSKIIFFWL